MKNKNEFKKWQEIINPKKKEEEVEVYTGGTYLVSGAGNITISGSSTMSWGASGGALIW